MRFIFGFRSVLDNIINVCSELNNSKLQSDNCHNFITIWILWPSNKQMYQTVLIFGRCVYIMDKIG